MRGWLISSTLLFFLGAAIILWEGSKTNFQFGLGYTIWLFLFLAAFSALLPGRYFASEIRDERRKKDKKLKDTFK